MLSHALPIVKHDTSYDFNLKFHIVSVSEILHSKQVSTAVLCALFCLVVNFGTLYLDVPGLNLILPLLLLRCETLFLASRYERRLRVFDNRVLRRIFGPKSDEVTQEL